MTVIRGSPSNYADIEIQPRYSESTFYRNTYYLSQLNILQVAYYFGYTRLSRYILEEHLTKSRRNQDQRFILWNELDAEDQTLNLRLAYN